MKRLMIAMVLLPAAVCAGDPKKAAAAKEQDRKRDEKYKQENQNIQLEVRQGAWEALFKEAARQEAQRQKQLQQEKFRHGMNQ